MIYIQSRACPGISRLDQQRLDGHVELAAVEGSAELVHPLVRSRAGADRKVRNDQILVDCTTVKELNCDALVQKDAVRIRVALFYIYMRSSNDDANDPQLTKL